MMPFVVEGKEPDCRIFDAQRGLELGSAGGWGHTRHYSYFHKIGDPASHMGGAFKWEKTYAEAEEEIRRQYPPDSLIHTFFVGGKAPGVEPLQIRGCSRKETIEIIREALEARRFMLRHKVDEERFNRIVYRVVFWPEADKWVAEEFE